MHEVNWLCIIIRESLHEVKIPSMHKTVMPLKCVIIVSLPTFRRHISQQYSYLKPQNCHRNLLSEGLWPLSIDPCHLLRLPISWLGVMQKCSQAQGTLICLGKLPNSCGTTVKVLLSPSWSRQLIALTVME